MWFKTVSRTDPESEFRRSDLLVVARVDAHPLTTILFFRMNYLISRKYEFKESSPSSAPSEMHALHHAYDGEHLYHLFSSKLLNHLQDEIILSSLKIEYTKDSDEFKDARIS